MVTCHETGHLLGKISMRQSDDFIMKNFDFSPESEADYWGGACILDFVKEKDLRLSEIDNRCSALNSEEQEHCSYAIKLYLKAYSRLFKVNVNPEAAREQKFEKGNGIDFRYGSADCRALSSIQGIIKKERPTCWYNPKQVDRF